MSSYRKIIHVDMDAFYAQIEQRDNPRYRNKPIVIGSGNRKYGIVSTCSYEARKFGIRSAMSSMDAYNKCHDAIFVRQNMEKYIEESKKIREIFLTITDKVEIASIDEAYLDVTENNTPYTSAIKIAMLIKDKIYQKTKLTCSVGVSYNKMLAKVSSEMNKPNGIFIIPPAEAIDFIKEMDINKIPGIGKVTYQKMQTFGIYKGKDVYEYSKEDLIKYFGKSGIRLYNLVRGIDERDVINKRNQKSIAYERTINYQQIKIDNVRQSKEFIVDEINNVVRKMVEKGYIAKTLTIKIKYHDFQMYTRSYSFEYHHANVEDFIGKIDSLLIKFPHQNKEVRLVGVSLSNLQKTKYLGNIQKQLTLF